MCVCVRVRVHAHVHMHVCVGSSHFGSRLEPAVRPQPVPREVWQLGPWLKARRPAQLLCGGGAGSGFASHGELGEAALALVVRWAYILRHT